MGVGFVCCVGSGFRSCRVLVVIVIVGDGVCCGFFGLVYVLGSGLVVEERFVGCVIGVCFCVRVWFECFC